MFSNNSKPRKELSMFCSKCGSENKSEARFCHNCGTAMLVDEQPIIVNRDASNGKPKKKRGIVKSVFYGLLWLAGIFFVLLIVLAVVGSSEIACDDDDVTELLRDAIDKSQFARQQGLSAANIQNIQDTGSVEDNLSCTADITFNSLSESKVAYTVKPNGDGQYWLEFQIVGGV